MTLKATPEQIRNFLSSHRRVETGDGVLIKAGVLIALFHRMDELHVLLTKRTKDVEHHKGQISFPGGSADPSDRDIVETALRETEEEIGIRPPDINVLGLFNDVWTPSGFRITPVIGFLRTLPPMIVNRKEVEEVLELPVSFFLDRNNEHVKSLSHNGVTRDVYSYHYGSNEIWGATAGMLHSFLAQLQEYLVAGDRKPV